MIGAIAGDIIGSRHEFKSFKSKDFELFTGGSKFTDDSLMTLAIAEAFILWGGGESYEDSVRNAISLGGDADTQGAITGSIAEAYYGVPPEIEEKALSYLTEPLLSIYHAFSTVKRRYKGRK